VGEMRSHPFTLVTVLALVVFAIYTNSTHANSGEIQELSKKVVDNTGKIDKVLMLQIAESLRNLQNQKCATDDHEAQRVLDQTIDDLQAEYRSITGERYPLQGCS
jgi:hypothetical protein